jgi:glycosyltransferase involved in cell wall biosynthesis
VRVLLVNDQAPGPGSGVEVHLERLARGLRDAGDDVELFAGEVLHRGPGRALDLWDPRARWLLAARARAFAPEVVHHHHVVRELSSAVLGVPPGVPQVLTVHDLRLLGDPDAVGALAAAKRLKALLDRSRARTKVDVVVAMSEPLAEALGDAGFERVVLVPPFADPPDERPPPPSACLNVAFAGRLAEDKGFGVLADAWPHVLAAHPWARLAVAGAGPMALRVSALDRVDQLGAVSTEEVREMFAAARVVVVPSMTGPRADGPPTVAIEAALCGRPLVVSDDDRGLAELVQASGGGLVTPVGDAAAVAAAVNRLLEDDVAADALGAAGAAYAAAHHTTQAGVAALRAVYESVLG